MLKRGKKGQATIFVIIALVIVALAVGFVLLKDSIIPGVQVMKFQEVYDYFDGCINDATEKGVLLLGQSGGYIYMPEFEIGSEYRPFSSQLNFMGTPVPYWYYVSGKNTVKEQAPTKDEMTKQLQMYIEDEGIKGCDLSGFEARGYNITWNDEDTDVSVDIEDDNVNVNVVSSLVVSKADQTETKDKHNVEVTSSLGRFYDIAKGIYNKEKSEMFLERYSIDVLRLYAPVDGVEISCSPKIWTVSDVETGLREGLEANVQALRLKNDYSMNKKNRDYFTIDADNKGESVRFLYDKNWATRIEIWESKNGIMMADSIGNQQGLGIIGFCYVPYHFVYDVNFPVMIQVYNEYEIFQFPVAVVIEKNKERNALDVETEEDVKAEICEKAVQDVDIYTYNIYGEGIPADVSFKCFTDLCELGKTELNENDAVLKTKVPQCFNGAFVARAEGYKDGKVQASTNEVSETGIELSKLFNLSVVLNVDGKETEDLSVIVFSDGQETNTVVYPQQKDIRLSEGYYNVSVYVYSNSTIKLAETRETKCVDVPKKGIFGLFGGTDKQCFEIKIPEQIVSSAITGGGKGVYYITTGELEEANKVEIDVESFGKPTNLEDLEENYNKVEVSIAEVSLL